LTYSEVFGCLVPPDETSAQLISAPRQGFVLFGSPLFCRRRGRHLGR
jgi:hypothetical protein